jgi:hypothetical protein
MVGFSDKVILNGEKYVGRFLGNKSTDKSWTRGEYTEREVRGYFWNGEGIVTNTETKESERFLFVTEGDEHGRSYTLEHELVSFDEKPPFHKESRIVKYGEVVDLVLEKMYEDSMKALEGVNVIIPHISVPRLKANELVEMGLVSEGDGQVRLALG